jgi:hypothetical protein
MPINFLFLFISNNVVEALYSEDGSSLLSETTGKFVPVKIRFIAQNTITNSSGLGMMQFCPLC